MGFSFTDKGRDIVNRLNTDEIKRKLNYFGRVEVIDGNVYITGDSKTIKELGDEIERQLRLSAGRNVKLAFIDDGSQLGKRKYKVELLERTPGFLNQEFLDQEERQFVHSLPHTLENYRQRHHTQRPHKKRRKRW